MPHRLWRLLSLSRQCAWLLTCLLRSQCFCFLVESKSLATVDHFLFCAWWSVKTICFLHCSNLSFCFHMVLSPPGENGPGTTCVCFLMIKAWTHQSLAFETLKSSVKVCLPACLFNRQKTMPSGGSVLHFPGVAVSLHWPWRWTKPGAMYFLDLLGWL